MQPYPKIDFNVRPLVVVWEMTQACDLTCLHCRAEAQPLRNEDELSTLEAKRFLEQVAELDPGVLVLSGGDPMKRPDVYELVKYGQERGLRMAMTPSVTPLLTDEAIHRLAAEGLSRIAFSLDGSTPEIHDSFRGVAGSFARTIQAMESARNAGLPLQINTTVSRHNMADLPALAELLSTSHIELWSVFFLVPIGRGKADQRIAPEEYEEVFELLWSLRQRVPFEIKSTEAPHYRRFVLQKLAKSRGLQPAQDLGRRRSVHHRRRTARAKARGSLYLAERERRARVCFRFAPGGCVSQRIPAHLGRECAVRRTLGICIKTRR